MDVTLLAAGALVLAAGLFSGSSVVIGIGIGFIIGSLILFSIGGEDERDS